MKLLQLYALTSEEFLSIIDISEAYMGIYEYLQLLLCIGSRLLRIHCLLVHGRLKVKFALCAHARTVTSHLKIHSRRPRCVQWTLCDWNALLYRPYSIPLTLKVYEAFACCLLIYAPLIAPENMYLYGMPLRYQ